MSRAGMDRRRFLQMALGAGGVVAVAGLRPWRALVRVTNQSLGARFAGLLSQPASAGLVGREYLHQPAAERNVQTLVDAIAERLPGGGDAAAGATASELRELVASAVSRDFDEGVVVRLQGWVVSRTEARLCALAAAQGHSGEAASGRRLRGV